MFLPAAEDAGLAGGKELAEYTEAKRNAAHDAVNAAVKSERLRVFLVDFFHWMEEGNWRQGTSAKPQKSVEDFARAASIDARGNTCLSGDVQRRGDQNFRPPARSRLPNQAA